MVLRIVKFLNRSTTSLEVQFSEELSNTIGVANISVESGTVNTTGLTVKAITVDSDILRITTSPQFPFSFYTLKFAGTTSQPFDSISGDRIQEDNVNNIVQFLGLEGPNPVRDDILDNVSPVYNVEEPTFIRDLFSNSAETIYDARNDIRETGNANFIDVEVPDELRRRGFSATDRLGNEGAYKVTRVALNATGASLKGTIEFNAARATAIPNTDSDRISTQITSFTADPVSLRTISVVREEVSNTVNASNSFDELVVSLANQNVIQIHAVKLIESGGAETVYNLPEYGYAIQDNRYDTLNGNRLVTLESNQFRISEASVFDGAFPLPSSADTLEVSYAYLDNGVNVDGDTVAVTQVIEITRQSVPAFLTIFSLGNFPIVTSADATPTSAGVQFLDPNPSGGASPFTVAHPAFTSEIVFSETRLPARPGEYAVDYATGTVYVFGAVTNDGTGSAPPVASYFYRKSFVQGVDYDFEPDADEISANVTRSLIGEEVKVAFDYEQVLAEGTDYLAPVHAEVVDESVENSFYAPNEIRPRNTPITNVFRLFNSTTGENYILQRFTDNAIFIEGVQLPRVEKIENELATFDRQFNESLNVTEVISQTGSYQVVRLDLTQENIMSETEDFVGANINTSVLFGDTGLFVREFFYDNVLQSLTTNLAKLSANGDYLINYVDGVVYLRTALTTTDYGDVSYTYGAIRTQRPRILSVDEVAYRKTVRDDALQTFEQTFTSENIFPRNLTAVGERFLSGDTNKPILLGMKQFGSAGQRNVTSNVFTALDAVFDSSHADGNHLIRFPDDSDRLITAFISSTAVEVDVPFTDTNRSVNWCLLDLTLSDGYQAVTTYDIVNVRAVYSVTDLQSNDKDSLTNLWDPELDTFSGNTLTFNSTGITSVAAGDALVVEYTYGSLYVAYDQLFDNLIISYEYGDNSIDFSIGDAVDSGQDYFVTYNYGALREALLANFGSLTQLEELSTFPLSTDRELYRDAVAGALQSFVRGPTVESVENIVSSITDVTPDVRELTFNEFTIGRDNLYLQPGELTGTETYANGRFNDGLFIADGTTLKFPAEAYISLREGTFEAWVVPEWRGLDNDAVLTFDIGEDGYSATTGTGLADGYILSLSDIYIGESAYNPTSMPFSISRFDVEPNSAIGRPTNYGQVPGYFIWYDTDLNEWKTRFVENPQNLTRFTGEITTTGQFYNVRDGYNTTTSLFVNELNDYRTSTFSYIRFDAQLDLNEGADGYDGYIGVDGYDGYFSQDGFDFLSDNLHYIFDTGPSLSHNRISLFKDGQGYLNFRAYDSSGQRRPGTARMYNISHDISSWAAAEQHFLAVSWRFNSAQGVDEMHLFVDGQEVSNNFKYGGRPVAAHGTDIYRTVADEVVTASAVDNIISASDGRSFASNVFRSASVGFLTNGITAGDTLTILDATADQGTYTIATVDSDVQVTLLGVPLLLSLSNISFSLNQLSYTASTNVTTEKIAVFAQDGYGVVTELAGVDAETPDYTVSRSGPDNILTINNGVSTGDLVFINTLGLTRGRVRDIVFDYNTDNVLRTNLAPPVAMNHIDIYKYIFRRTAIEDDGYALLGDGFFQDNTTTFDGYFTDVCQPSNTVTGKTLRVTLHGTNDIDFTGTNEVIIEGSPSNETISFTDYGSEVSTTLFTSITSLDFTFTPSGTYDGYGSIGAVEIIEDIPLTESENSGNYATVASYNNGSFTLHQFGSGGAPFNLESCYYLLDYPIALNISLNRKGDLYLGSDLNGNNSLNGILDEVIILNEQLTDIRAGEVPPSTQRTVTQDYNSIFPIAQTPQTMMQLRLDGNLDNIETFYTTYNEDYMTTSNSVNANFGDAAILYDDPILIDNGATVFDNSDGTIEFWVSPMIDTLNDMDHTRYYIDIVAAQSADITSTTAITLFLPQRARKVESVRLLSDDGTGTDFFAGGSLGIDGKTIRLGTRLPAQRTLVRVNYIPIDLQGDRVSIYKDGYGTLNFEVKASDQVFQLAYPIAWERNTWHRVKVMWDLNNLDGQDRLRMFVDGVETSTVLYGTAGVIYGIGILYGTASVAGSDFLTTNIDLTDTFSDILIGNNRDGTGRAMARMDNLRFSNSVREPSVVAGSNVDLNFNSNRDAAQPVIEDDRTTLLLDFDKEIAETQFLANLLRESTPLFLFDVDVIDSFDRITGDTTAQDLIESLINRLKPTHTQSFVRFL